MSFRSLSTAYNVYDKRALQKHHKVGIAQYCYLDHIARRS